MPTQIASYRAAQRPVSSGEGIGRPTAKCGGGGHFASPGMKKCGINERLSVAQVVFRPSTEVCTG